MSPVPSPSFGKSILLGTLLVGLACTAVECAAVESTAYFGGSSLASKYERARRLAGDGPVRVFALGPSHVDNGFDAELFTERTGQRAFNFAVAGTDLHFQALFARNILIPLFRPTTIFWGVLDRLNTGNPINDQYLDAPVLARAAGPLGARIVAFEHILPHWKKRRLAQWYERCFGTQEAASEPFGQTRESGVWDQVPGERSGKALEREEARAQGLDVPTPDPDATRAAVEEALRFAREQGVQVYVFLAPYDPANFELGAGYSVGRVTDRFKEYEQWLLDVLARHGATLINLRYCAGITDADDCFFQPRHLNQQGARRMTEILARIFLGAPVAPEWRGIPSSAEQAALGSAR